VVKSIAAVLAIALSLSLGGSLGAAAAVVPHCTTALTESIPPQQRQGVEARMVPGFPVRVVGCRYALQDVGGGMAAMRLVSANLLPADATARAFNALRASTGPPTCPASQTSVVLIFEYRSGRRLLIGGGIGGCSTASNGARVVVMPTALQDRLLNALAT